MSAIREMNRRGLRQFEVWWIFETLIKSIHLLRGHCSAYSNAMFTVKQILFIKAASIF